MIEEVERNYRIVLHKKAKRELKRLPKDLLQQIDTALMSLSRSARSSLCNKRTGFDNLYDIHLGDWSLVYAMEENNLVVLMIEISHDKRWRNGNENSNFR